MDRFDIYFGSLVAMTLHPGFNKPDTPKPSMEELAEQALKMMKIREEKCPS